MLFIDPNDIKIIKARKNFQAKMVDLVIGRTKKLKKFNYNPNVIIFFESDILPILLDILTASPAKLLTINKKISTNIHSNIDIEKGIRYVFDYKWFIDRNTKSRYNAYDLAHDIDINTCIYCNRNYTNTVITRKKEKLIRPQFDHYFDKDTYPLLALSFFNLIPCCSICNSTIKHKKAFLLSSHIHPYIDNSLDKFHFSYKYSSRTKNGIEIKIKSTYLSAKVKKTLEDLKIEEIYNAHTDEVFDLIKTRQAYSDRYLNILVSTVLKGINISKEEIYRLTFGTYFNEKDFIKRPFSKLKKDILKELGVI